MLLCIDIGNTNVMIGFVESKTVTATFRYGTNVNFTADEYYQKIKDILKEYKPDACIISSVVPSLNKVFIEITKKYLNLNPKIVNSASSSPLKICIDNPKELGADLIADAVGAYTDAGSACVVVDLGTATKILAVNSKGEFKGCVIAPGIKGSLNSLFSSAALLSHTSIEVPEHIIGTNSTTSIQSGITYGTACMVDGMVELTIKELNEENVKVYLTGGYGIIIKDILKTKVIYDHELTIKGMVELYYYNK